MDNIHVGYWWKSTGYELHAGHIRPTAGAKWTMYDPWAEFQEAHTGTLRPAAGKRMIDAPFLRLLDLTEIDPVTGPEPQADRILNWCAQFGLLGILPHCASSITLPARWKKTDIGGAAAGAWRAVAGIASDQLVPVVDQYFRTPTGWAALSTPYAPVRAYRGETGIPVQPADLPTDCPRPSVVWTDLGQSHPEIRPFEYLRRFFPTWVDDFEVPLPLSPRFRELYAEPLHTFWNAALIFRRVVKTLGRRAGTPAAKLDGAQANPLQTAVTEINALVSPVSSFLAESTDGKLVQRWACPSLIASFSLMALSTWAQGRLRVCAVCDEVFETTALQGKYCSGTCGETARKRAVRARQAEAREMYADGKSIESIARKLKTTVAQVEKWLRDATSQRTR